METVFFCHGMPGSKADATLLRKANPKLNIVAIDLLGFAPRDADLAFSKALNAEEVVAEKDKIVLTGFSIGAMAAIKIAAAHPNIVSRLILISPAAPLSLGDFLPQMAGRTVFELALARPMLLRALTAFQGLIARWSPDRVVGLLFRNCGEAEKALLEDPDFKTSLTQALMESFVRCPDAYLAYINAYVSDWKDSLDLLTCPVELWHGSKDTWSPPQMSFALCNTFGEKAKLRLIEGTEHYSTMAQVIL
ncbi:alpha/beta fold hydrolase [Marivivens marinus]|uniref:alpha/beta fold hydrolase n=1 Tax=Marivivens marinus TaxID=3110173 RepID=UPI003B8499ED